VLINFYQTTPNLVVETILQLVFLRPFIAKYIYVLTDCMSVVQAEGAEQYVDEKFAELKALGVNFLETKDMIEIAND